MHFSNHCAISESCKQHRASRLTQGLRGSLVQGTLPYYEHDIWQWRYDQDSEVGLNPS